MYRRQGGMEELTGKAGGVGSQRTDRPIGGWAMGGESCWWVATSSLLDRFAVGSPDSPGQDVCHTLGLVGPDI